MWCLSSVTSFFICWFANKGPGFLPFGCAWGERSKFVASLLFVVFPVFADSCVVVSGHQCHDSPVGTSRWDTGHAELKVSLAEILELFKRSFCHRERRPGMSGMSQPVWSLRGLSFDSHLFLLLFCLVVCLSVFSFFYWLPILLTFLSLHNNSIFVKT